MKKRIVVLMQVFMLLLSLVVFVPVESMESLSINAPSQVDEGEVFQVNVTVGDDPIEGAEVIWQGARYLTKSDGIVDLTAPLVDESGYHTICAEHPGYISACLDPGIRVTNIGTLPLNIALEPSSVLEGENFVVTVTSSSNPVYNATITVGWGTPRGSYATDKNGEVTITAPGVSEDMTYLINASKTGYLNETANIVVLDEMQPLAIHVDISIVLEGVPFQVRVTSNDHIDGIEGVLVTFNDHGYYTNESGEVTILAPMVEQNTIYLIEASKSGYEDQNKEIIVMDTSTTSPALVIDSPTSVYENQTFLVTIISEEYTQPIEGATVTFDDSSYSTNDDGEVNLIAPPVGETTNYVVTAHKEGYIDASVTITVLNVGEIEPPESADGWIFGIITDESGIQINGVLVCIVQTYEANKCTYSNEDGMYTIFASTGTYSVQASKYGYISKTQEVIILKNQSTELNFILQDEEIPSEPTTDVSAQLVEEKINEEIGKIGAKINVDEGQSVVSYFSDDIQIRVDIDEYVQCTVNASEDTPGTILVFRIGNYGGSNFEDEISITYDGESISEIFDVEAFFNTQQNTEPSWLRFSTPTGMYILFNIPHFSEHTITIASIAEVVETIINLTVVALYIVVIIVLAVVTAIPIVRLWKKIE